MNESTGDNARDLSPLKSEIDQLLSQLPSGDKARVLAFVQAIHQARTGKKNKRRDRHKSTPSVPISDLLRS